MNGFQNLIYQAINQGVSEETIILLLLLPLVTSIVAATRHLIGFRGFGILIPTTLSVVFVAAGIWVGITMFAAILLMATFARVILKKLKLQYLPRMALLLWFVSLGVLVIVFLFSSLGLRSPKTISILPILILVLLAEEFIAVQIGKSLKEATRLTVETILIALVGFLIFSSPQLRLIALNRPHLVILFPLVLNLLVGRYTGLRLLEYRRFRKLLK